jgi:hypothetical protein
LPLRRGIWKVENMKGDIALAGFMLTAEEWQAFDRETRAQLCAVATRRFATGTEPPQSRTVIAGGTIIDERPKLAEGSGPHDVDEYIDLFDD